MRIQHCVGTVISLEIALICNWAKSQKNAAFTGVDSLEHQHTRSMRIFIDETAGAICANRFDLAVGETVLGCRGDAPHLESLRSSAKNERTSLEPAFSSCLLYQRQLVVADPACHCCVGVQAPGNRYARIFPCLRIPKTVFHTIEKCT